MSKFKIINAIVEGQTEQQFIKEVLAPYLSTKSVSLYAAILRKPGENGGDVRFSRAKNDIEKFLKQRDDTQVTIMLDYYGIRSDWPGYDDSKKQKTHAKKHAHLIQKTMEEVQRLFENQNAQTRFIPYFSMYEIEALYFCNPTVLSQAISVNKKEIDKILAECGEPEKINDSSATAPSKRLRKLSHGFRKTSTGLTIAQNIGIQAMRDACPLFDAWVTQLEAR